MSRIVVGSPEARAQLEIDRRALRERIWSVPYSCSIYEEGEWIDRTGIRRICAETSEEAEALVWDWLTGEEAFGFNWDWETPECAAEGDIMHPEVASAREVEE